MSTPARKASHSPVEGRKTWLLFSLHFSLKPGSPRGEPVDTGAWAKQPLGTSPPMIQKNSVGKGEGTNLRAKKPGPAHFFLSFFCLFAISWAAPTAYGGSQARGRIRAVATVLHQSHSNAGSEPRLQPTPQLTATPDP